MTSPSDAVSSTHAVHHMPRFQKIAGYASAVAGVALVVFAMCLGAGLFGPGVSYHFSAYLGAGCALFSIIPFAVALCLLDTSEVPRKAE
ncbi:MAG: hypothetical protein JSS62_05285 [Verrucomicrobia bacterium]|nr:hypothetical protein [Verrucomicrobiota bacterium]MBS0647438.1 hypothetical protein [Verrucomicrobiota bacterium]